MESILVRAIAPETSGNLTENVPPNPQHSSGDVHFREREALHFRQQLSRAGFNAQLAEGVATVVISDDAVKSRADIFDARDFQQEARKLPDARLQRMDLGEELGIVLEDVREVMRDHRRAGARGTMMYSESRKTSRKCRAIVARFVRIAGVERRLAAAGLGFGKVDLVAQALQHLRDGDADLGKNLIDDAGDKQGDALAQCGEFNMPGELRIEAVELITVGERPASRGKLPRAGARQHFVFSAHAVRVVRRGARAAAKHRAFVQQPSQEHRVPAGGGQGYRVRSGGGFRSREAARR